MEVTLLNSMGNDLTVVNAARVSFNKHSEEMMEKDERLIQYLASHNHWTPFSHLQFQFVIKAPIFVARQLWKSHVGSSGGDCNYAGWNEVSRRYVDSEPEFYSCEFRGRPEGSIKQGSGDVLGPADAVEAAKIQGFIHGAALGAYYELKALGVAPEQIRALMPQSMYTEWWWSGSLAFFHRVYQLRIASEAQKETQEIARLIGEAIEPLCPVSWRALNDARN